MASRKSKFTSLSTPGTRQDCSNYLVELAFLKSNRGIRLPPKFWQQVKYKFRYRREIQACRKFIKKYGEGADTELEEINAQFKQYKISELLELQEHYKEKIGGLE